jgi:hypothetical protein
LIHSMRLSLVKGAHTDLSSASWQENRGQARFCLPRRAVGLEWDATALDAPFLAVTLALRRGMYANNRVRKVDLGTGIISTFAGNGRAVTGAITVRRPAQNFNCL